jgi:signal transduction histidine kinase
VAVFLVARLVAALLLASGGYAAMRARHDRANRPAWEAAVPAVATTAVAIGLALTDAPLDTMLTPQAIEHLTNDPGSPLSLGEVSPPLFLAQLGIGALFLLAAWFAYRRAVGYGQPADGFLAAGLILAAFSQVHFAVNPGSYVSLVTTGDGLRVAFYTVLLAGIVVQSRTDVRALREANVELARLRDAEVHHALTEERGRLAREVHDGLAQDLWTARLMQGRLAQTMKAGDQRRLAEDVMDAIDAGIADARQAVMAMRAGSDDAPLYDVLQRYLDDFSDRFALRATFEARGTRPPLEPRVQAEILRIVQEALNNTRKHADATTVAVSASAVDGRFELVVADNGRGFDPDANGRGFGLISMRERAELIGATLKVRSAPSDGTRIHLSLPLSAGQAR